MTTLSTLFTIAEAAKYCGITQSAVRRAFRENGGRIFEVAATSAFGARVVQAVRRDDVDRLRAAGFLNGRPGRRKNGVTRRKTLAAG